MSATTPLLTGPAPAGVDTPCAYLEQVLGFHASNGGPFLRSVELEYAVRRLARAWIVAQFPERALPPWLALAAVTAFGPGASAAALARELRGWAVDECLLLAGVTPAGPANRAGGA